MIAVIPAAGIGQRMGAALPKQYLQCAGATLLDHSISALLADKRITKIYVSLHPEDTWFSASGYAQSEQIERVIGGDDRASSVQNALSVAIKTNPDNCLVVVHDAARPGLPLNLLSKLLDVAQASPAQGALLALPIRDTVKYVAPQEPLSADSNNNEPLPQVTKTLNRDELWLAQTPQVFRLGDLQRALELAELSGSNITDEASAMEAQGVQPVLVTGSRVLMKVTDPEDLALIEFYLTQMNGSV